VLVAPPPPFSACRPKEGMGPPASSNAWQPRSRTSCCCPAIALTPWSPSTFLFLLLKRQLYYRITLLFFFFDGDGEDGESFWWGCAAGRLDSDEASTAAAAADDDDDPCCTNSERDQRANERREEATATTTTATTTTATTTATTTTTLRAAGNGERSVSVGFCSGRARENACALPFVVRLEIFRQRRLTRRRRRGRVRPSGSANVISSDACRRRVFLNRLNSSHRLH